MPTILLTHSHDERKTRFDDEAFAALEALGSVQVNAGGAILDVSEVAALAAGCDIVVCDRLTPFPADFFAAAPTVRAVCRGAVDIRNIDIDAASEAGVLVTHAGPTFIAAVAELTLGMMIDLARGITGAATAYRAGRFPEAGMGVQLSGATLGVIGYGAIGRQVAALGRAFGMDVLVADPHAAPDRDDMDDVGLETLLDRSDFVVCLAISVPETDRMIDGEALARMKPTAFFLNLARGPLVDDDALKEALVSGRIAGAAIDVGNEPGQMPRPDIAALPSVIATPHIGGLTRQAAHDQAMETVGQVRSILAGEIPHGALNGGYAARLSGQ
mgnify:CR=1 FL=1